MATSSANPEDMQSFLQEAQPATKDMATKVSALVKQIQTYVSLPSDYKFVNGEAIGQDASTFVTNNESDEKFVATVRQKFVEADATTLPDGDISVALSSAGLSASPRTALTIDDPTFQGKPLDSGWSDDPVCTSTGHFLEQRADLAMPTGLRVLAAERTYSSRFIAPTSLGRGWYGWADASLVERDGAAYYQGPDGQRTSFPATDGGFAPVAGMEGTVVRTSAGLRLQWRWAARFPGMVWDFDADGRLLTLSDPFGRTTTADHDDEGRLTTLTHAGGRSVAFKWEGDRLSALVASDGRRVTYDYRGDDLHLVAGDLSGERYETDDDGHLLSVVDADGVVLADNTFDEDGRVLTQTSPFGRTTRYHYLEPHTVVVSDTDGGPSTLFRHDRAGRLIELRDADDAVSTRVFDDRGNVAWIVDFDGGRIDRRYDTQGNCTWERRADGSVRTWTWDERGRLTAHTDADGATTGYRYRDDDPWPAAIDEPLGRTTRWEVTDDGRRRVDADGVGTAFGVDGDGIVVAATNDLGETVRITPHPSGRPASIELADGARWSYERDGAGRLLAETSPLGHRTEHQWSPAGRHLATIDAAGGETRSERGVHGETERLLEPGGRVSTGTWDRLGHLTSVSPATGGTWAYDYDGMANLTSVVGPDEDRWSLRWRPGGALADITDPTGAVWATEHDALGRPTATVTPLGRRLEVQRDGEGRVVAAGNDTGSVWSALLDANGLPLQYDADGEALVRWTYSAAGRPLAAHLPDGTSWRCAYDGAGRLTGLTEPDGSHTAVAYDRAGRVAGVTAPTGGVTSYEWDADGRLVAVAEGDARTAVELDAVGRVLTLTRPGLGPVALTYDGEGALSSVTDPLGATTAWRRDRATRSLDVTDGAGSTRQRRFDATGRLAGYTDGLGRIAAIRRDGRGRQVAFVGGDGTDRRFGWDADGRLRSVHDGDRALFEETGEVGSGISRILGPDGTEVVRQFDAHGRIAATSVDGRSVLTGFTSDAVTVALPDGDWVAWEHDSRGRPARVEHPAVGRITVTYDGSGGLAALEADGFSRRFERDPWGRVTGYEERIGHEVRRTEILRDRSGRVVGEIRDGRRRSYTYDAAGQLTAVDDGDRRSVWTYDTCGRMTIEAITDGTTTRTRSFTYDDADQLRTITDERGTTELDYDGAGRRLAERGADGAVRYRWDGLGHLVGVERDDASAKDALVVDALGELRSAGGAPVDWAEGGPGGTFPVGLGNRTVVGLPGQPVATVTGGRATWVSCDWRGSTADVSDPWGAGRDDGGAGLGYLGEVRIGDLVWLRRRVYDPRTHAFLSPDPRSGTLGYPGAATNRYAYANNDPVGWVDPSGLQPMSMDQANAMMKGWKQSHWGKLAVGTLGFVGAGVLIALSGGAAAVIIPAVLGAGLGAGGTALTDAIEHKPINGWDLFQSAGLGAFTGAAGGGDTANPGLISNLTKEGSTLLSKPVLTGLFSAGTSFIGSEADHPTIDPAELASYAESAGESGVVSGAFSKVSLSNSMLSGKTSSELTQLAETDPAAMQALDNNKLLANSVIAPNKTIFQSFTKAGLSKIPTPAPTSTPAGVNPADGQPMTASQLQQYVASGG